MPKLNKLTTLFDEPRLDAEGSFVPKGLAVEILPSPAPWMFAEPQANWLHVKAPSLPGQPVGFVHSNAVDMSDTPIPAVTLQSLAEKCWLSSFKCGVDAHYLAAMAKLRSDVSLAPAGLEIGIFRQTQDEWNAWIVTAAAPSYDTAFTPADNNDWRNQCDLYGIATVETERQFSQILQRDPNAVELCLAQLIGVKGVDAALKAPQSTFDQVLGSLAKADLPPAATSAADLVTRFAALLKDAPAVQGEPPAPPITGNTPRSIRNKNPGNIVDPGQNRFNGQTGEDADGFCIFDSMGAGFRAINTLLTTYRNHGLITPKQIVHTWAPGAQAGNNEAVYVNTFKTVGGFDADQEVGIDVDSRVRACLSIATQEGGKPPYDKVAIKTFLQNNGINAAKGTVGAALHRLATLLTNAVEATRDAIVTASQPYVSAEETPEAAKVPVTIPATPAGDQNFEAFFKDRLLGISGFVASEFLFMGQQNAENHKNFVPPQILWPNILKTATVLSALKQRLPGNPVIHILSAYRSPAYNAAIGGAKNSQHMQFSATDIYSPTVNALSLWQELVKMRNEGFFQGGLGHYASFAHIDTRGVNQDWSG